LKEHHRTDLYGFSMIRLELKLLFVFALFFIGVVSLVVYINMQSERSLVEEVEKDLEEVGRTVHFSTQKLSAERGPDRETLERFIEEVKSKKGVREVSVVGSTHEIIASSNPNKVGQHRELTGQEIVVREQLGEEDTTGHYIHYQVKVPLIRNDQVIGLVQTSIVVEDYRYFLRKLFFKNLSVAAGVMLFAFGAVFFVLSRLNQPLRRLTFAAERVASGDLTIQLKGRRRDEVGRLTTAFNAMIQRLSEQQQLEDKLHGLERRAILSEMASSLAHEIRNPLNLINLTADHLGQQFQPDGDERRQAYQDLIQGLKAEVRHLNQMVNEFLNVGRPAKLKKVRFAWKDLLDQVQGLVKHQLASKKITLEWNGQTDLTITADLEQLRLVFLNLFLNAMEAVPENGRIAVHVEKDVTTGKVVVSIADNGPGIKPEDLDRIFDPYFTKRPGGTGLGLALVRRIVEEHGGKIQAANQPGGGARFEITLPIEG
jgi:nitrogen fixation/metabolism regulation signal transduction histidine kinase